MLLAVKKHRTHTKTLVLLLKVFLFLLPFSILLYDVSLSLQPRPKLTLIGYAKVTDGDTLMVSVTFLTWLNTSFQTISTRCLQRAFKWNKWNSATRIKSGHVFAGW